MKPTNLTLPPVLVTEACYNGFSIRFPFKSAFQVFFIWGFKKEAQITLYFKVICAL